MIKNGVTEMFTHRALAHKISLKLSFAAFLIIISAWPVWAATYYVKAGGNDNLNGLSDATAWATISKAQSVAASGDTVYFRSQDTWASNIQPVMTTTAGVTYDGSTYGTGTRATFQAKGGVNDYGMVSIQAGSQSSPVVFQGFKVDGKGLAVGGIYIGYPNALDISYVTVNNVEVTNGRNTDVGNQYYYGILVGQRQSHTTSNITIVNSEVHDTGHEGISIYPSWMNYGNQVNTVLVRNCNIYNTGLAGNGRGNPIDITDASNNVTVDFNYIHDNSISYGVTIVQYSDPNLGSPNRFTIRYNIIANNYGGIGANLAGQMTASGAIYGNILIDNGISFGGGDYNGSPIVIYNNTIYVPDVNNMWGGFGIYETAVNTSGIAFKNNIVYCSAGRCLYDYGERLTSSQHSNNLLYSASNGPLLFTKGQTYNSSNISSWETSVRTGNPAFTGGTLPTGFNGVYGTNMAPDTNYFSITSGNALRNGATLGSPYNGCINGAGLASPVLRPRGAYDIGAYQYKLNAPAKPRVVTPTN